MVEPVISLPGCSLDVAARRIVRQGRPVKIAPRVWRVLEHLVRFRHRVVTKQELFEALGSEGGASEATLKQAIRLARLAIDDRGSRLVIRSVPRVGYIFDPSQVRDHADDDAGAAEPAMQVALRVLMAPLRNDSGQPQLQWIEFGLIACVAHGLSQDRRLQLREPQSVALETARLDEPQHFKQALRASAADFLVSGTLHAAGPELALTLEVRCERAHDRLVVRAATAAGLVVPAIQALRRRFLGEQATDPGPCALGRCTLLSIEMFGRAMQAVSDCRHVAAARLLQVLEENAPAFPGVTLELLRARAACASPDGEETASRLLDVARATGDVVLEAQVRRDWGRLYAARGDGRQALRQFQEAVQVGSKCMPPDWLGHTLALFAVTELHQGQLHSLRAHLSQAQDICTAIGDRYLALNILWTRAVMVSLAGDAERAVRWNRRLAWNARRLRVPRVLMGACINLTLDLTLLYRLEEARQFVEEAIATAAAVENSIYLNVAANVGCLLYRLLNEPVAAADLLAQLPHPAHVPDNSYLWAAHGHAAMAANRWSDAAQHFVQAAVECRQLGNRVVEPSLIPWLIEALVRAGRLQAAHAELERAATQPHLLDESTTAKLLYPRALLARAEGRHADSIRLLQQLAQTPAAPPLFVQLGKELSRTPGTLDEVRRPVAAAHDLLRRQFRFGTCLLDVERREFWVDGRLSTLAPKPFEVLVYLHRNRHRLVSQDELLDALWPDGSGSPECVAQAIAKVRQAARTGGTTELVQTVYRKGYRLVADARPEPDEDADLSLHKVAAAAQQPRLAVLPLPRVAGRATASAVTAYRLSLIGHSVALHARMTLLSPGAIERCIAGIDTPTPEALLAAVRARRPDACAVHVGLSGGGDTLQLEYLVEATGVHLRGILKGASPTALGRALAGKLRDRLGRTGDDAPAAEHDPWVLRLFELASRAAEQRRTQEAARLLEVILDDDPDNRLVRELHAEVTQSMKASAA